ncbi:MAG: restriction endonuclease subunit S [Candidatus Cryptobacteroides sp.]|nr:restriction endonuclease subunit S [Candidatus Cryptobacteroides sp.]
MRFPEFSGEWEKVLLSSACEINPMTGSLDNQFLYIDLESVVKGSLVKRQIIEKDGAPSRAQRVLKENDILYQCVRPYQLNNYIFEGDTIQCVASTGYAQLRTTQFPLYIFQALHTKQFTNQVLERCTGTNYPAINSSDLGTVEVPICSLPEQVKIGSLLALIDSRIKTQNKIIEEQETFLKSLADKLFLQNNHYCQLSEIVNIVKGKQLNADTLSETGDYYVMNGGITPSGYYSEYNVPAGAISISEGGNSCGYVQFNEKPFWSGGHCYSLQCRTNLVDYKYIYYYLKTKEADVMALRIGSGLPNIQKKDIEKFTISYPSLQLQKQFVKALDALSGKINTEKNLLEKYCQQKSYLLSQMFI